jgi:hypothetical protein
MIKASEAIASLAFFVCSSPSSLQRVSFLESTTSFSRNYLSPYYLGTFVLAVRKLFPLRLIQTSFFSLMNLFFAVELFTGAGWKKVAGSE